jgi:hypothetical protein
MCRPDLFQYLSFFSNSPLATVLVLLCFNWMQLDIDAGPWTQISTLPLLCKLLTLWYRRAIYQIEDSKSARPSEEEREEESRLVG